MYDVGETITNIRDLESGLYEVLSTEELFEGMPAVGQLGSLEPGDTGYKWVLVARERTVFGLASGVVFEEAIKARLKFLGPWDGITRCPLLTKVDEESAFTVQWHGEAEVHERRVIDGQQYMGIAPMPGPPRFFTPGQFTIPGSVITNYIIGQFIV